MPNRTGPIAVGRSTIAGFGADSMTEEPRSTATATAYPIAEESTADKSRKIARAVSRRKVSPMARGGMSSPGIHGLAIGVRDDERDHVAGYRIAKSDLDAAAAPTASPADIEVLRRRRDRSSGQHVLRWSA